MMEMARQQTLVPRASSPPPHLRLSASLETHLEHCPPNRTLNRGQDGDKVHWLNGRKQRRDHADGRLHDGESVLAAWADEPLQVVGSAVLALLDGHPKI